MTGGIPSRTRTGWTTSGGLCRPDQFTPLPLSKPGPNNDLNELFDRHLRRHARLYGFGEPWGPDGGRDPYFGFLPQPHGWYCELIGPIDFDLLAARFELPDTIHPDPEHDRILDDGNHAEIYGGEGARALPGWKPPPPA